MRAHFLRSEKKSSNDIPLKQRMHSLQNKNFCTEAILPQWCGPISAHLATLCKRPYDDRLSKSERTFAMRILVADKLADEGLEFLKNAGIAFDTKIGLKEDELAQTVGEYDA